MERGAIMHPGDKIAYYIDTDDSFVFVIDHETGTQFKSVNARFRRLLKGWMAQHGAHGADIVNTLHGCAHWKHGTKEMTRSKYSVFVHFRCRVCANAFIPGELRNICGACVRKENERQNAKNDFVDIPLLA